MDQIIINLMKYVMCNIHISITILNVSSTIDAMFADDLWHKSVHSNGTSVFEVRELKKYTL